jgi:hypothetical protein
MTSPTLPTPFPAGTAASWNIHYPLELGGSSDITNLWPEVPAGGQPAVPNVKDKVEDAGNAAVCSGSMTLTAAQDAIAKNWIKFGQQLGVSGLPSDG